MSRGRAWVALAALVTVAGGAVALADELVTRDGQVIRTRGPWEVRGKLLVFTLADGTLASLRLDEADLEASERRARAAELRAQRAREAAMRPPAEPKEATVVLTDKDVAHAPPLDEQPEAEGGPDDVVTTTAGDQSGQTTQAGGTDQGADEGGDAGTQAVADTGRGVQVVQWSQEAEGEDGVALRGVIQNLGSSFATSLSVNALFYDEAGGLVAAREVEFDEGPLGPGARRNFSVSLPHSLVYDEIRFQVVGRGFRSVGQSVRAEAPAGRDTVDVP
ncbi:MAG: hypothetical protein ACE5EG_04155 [Thermoanaerobaculia bacterium]